METPDEKEHEKQTDKLSALGLRLANFADMFYMTVILNHKIKGKNSEISKRMIQMAKSLKKIPLIYVPRSNNSNITFASIIARIVKSVIDLFTRNKRFKVIVYFGIIRTY